MRVGDKTLSTSGRYATCFCCDSLSGSDVLRILYIYILSVYATQHTVTRRPSRRSQNKKNLRQCFVSYIQILQAPCSTIDMCTIPSARAAAPRRRFSSVARSFSRWHGPPCGTRTTGTAASAHRDAGYSYGSGKATFPLAATVPHTVRCFSSTCLTVHGFPGKVVVGFLSRRSGRSSGLWPFREGGFACPCRCQKRVRRAARKNTGAAVWCGRHGIDAVILGIVRDHVPVPEYSGIGIVQEGQFRKMYQPQDIRAWMLWSPTCSSR